MKDLRAIIAATLIMYQMVHGVTQQTPKSDGSTACLCAQVRYSMRCCSWVISSKPQKNSLLSNSPIYHLGRIFFQKLLKFSVFLMSDNDACLGILSDRTQLHVGVFTS